jgi:hypothetical protein
MPNNTIADNLQRLITAKTDIKNAILTKGGGVNEGDGLEDFADDILTIPSGGQTEWDVTLPEGTTNIMTTEGTKCGSITIGSDSISSLTLEQYKACSIDFVSNATVNNLFGITGIHTLNQSFFSYINSISSNSEPHIEYSCDVYVPAGIITLRGAYRSGESGGSLTSYFSINIFGTTICSLTSPSYSSPKTNPLIDQHFSYTDTSCTYPFMRMSATIPTYTAAGRLSISSGFQISNIVAKICL